MAVYMTKSMLNKLNKVSYPANSTTDIDETSFNSGDHWQRFYMDGNSFHLATELICRVCARHGDISLTEKIFGIDMLTAISSIANVSMQVDDSLPKFICGDCLEFLKVALTFKRNCQVADRRFKQILNPNGDPLMHSYPYSKHDFQLILHQMKLKRLKIAEKKEKERRKWEKLQEKKNEAKNKIEKFTCSPCDLSFPNREKLSEHRREKQCMRRACELCGQLVLSIAQHMRHIHKQNVGHKCPTCGKEFPVVARLRNHMLVHTNTFNFFCDLCPYKCKHKYYLVMHMRTHTGEKPYKCAQCVATFVNPSNLNKHKLTHQEKQFKCVMCDKAFRTTSALREHHEAAHMNIKHTCNYCGRDFCYKSDLRKHEIRSHNRTKRDYIGGEPTYKQVERMQKLQEVSEEPSYKHVERIKLQEVAELVGSEKWHHQEVPVLSIVMQPPPFVTTTYTHTHTHTHTLDHKELAQTSQSVYFSDVIIQQPQDMVQQPSTTVQLSLPELLKKDDVKLYETQQTIGYF